MGAVRNETAHADRAASPGRGDEHHLGHALFRHVAQVHPFAHGQPDRLDPGLELRVGVQPVTVLVSGDADIGGFHHHAGHAVVDQGHGHAIHHIDCIAAGQQRAAGRTGRVAKLGRNRGVGAGHAVNRGIALVGHHAARRLDGGDGDLPGVFHEDRNAGFVAGGRHQPAFDRKRANPGQDIAAVLGIGDDRLIDEDLQEQVIDVDPFAHRFADHRDLAGQRIGAAHPVDLDRIGATHHRQQERIARRGVGRQVVLQKITALGRAAAHPHAADGGIRHT